jgi:hypothetical protein
MRRLRETTASILLKRAEERVELQRFSVLLTCGSFILSLCTCWLLWNIVGWASALQAGFIVIVSVLGENYVSGLGYYRYSKANFGFINRVPIWIPFMWIAVIQGSLLVTSVYQPFNWMGILTSGIMCSMIDLSLIEPYFCRRKMLWAWNPVENGYFDFLPEELHRFTAPPGNYITWFLFPVLSNCLLFSLRIILRFTLPLF